MLARIVVALALCAPAACYQLASPLRTRLPPPSPVVALAAESSVMGSAPPALSLAAPAKVNLFLRILRRRGDGFHELSSLFQTVSLMDNLDFWQLPPDDEQPICSMEVSPDSLGAELIPTDETNLVMRALQIFAERTGEKRRVHCRLHKAVPAQGGLGGGSADAATALHAANRLAGFPVAQEELIVWGGELGSDVGFFLSRGTALCTGRGELIHPRPPLPPRDVWLVKPAEGLSTPAVYKALGLAPEEELGGPDPDELLAAFEGDGEAGEAEGDAAAAYVNDLEPPAYATMPSLAALRDELRSFGFDAVMMSGSGSTIFCVGQPRADARDTWQAELRARHDLEIFEERFCSRGPDERLWYGE